MSLSSFEEDFSFYVVLKRYLSWKPELLLEIQEEFKDHGCEAQFRGTFWDVCGFHDWRCLLVVSAQGQ
jgi:hypothetical protein